MVKTLKKGGDVYALDSQHGNSVGQMRFEHRPAADINIGDIGGWSQHKEKVKSNEDIFKS